MKSEKEESKPGQAHIQDEKKMHKEEAEDEIATSEGKKSKDMDSQTPRSQHEENMEIKDKQENRTNDETKKSLAEKNEEAQTSHIFDKQERENEAKSVKENHKTNTKKRNKELHKKKDKKKKKDKENGKNKKDKTRSKNTVELDVKDNTNLVLSDEVYLKLVSLADSFAHVSTMLREHNVKISKANDILIKVKNTLTQLETTQNTYQFIWKIENFSDHYTAARSGKQLAVYCPPVESHSYGYKIGITLCPNGDGVGRSTHMSLFFCIMKGEYDDLLPWPFSCPIRFTLLDQTPFEENNDRKNIVGIFKPNGSQSDDPYLSKPELERNKGLGLPRFVQLKKIFENKDRYLLDDTIFIKIEIDVDVLETRMD